MWFLPSSWWSIQLRKSTMMTHYINPCDWWLPSLFLCGKERVQRDGKKEDVLETWTFKFSHDSWCYQIYKDTNTLDIIQLDTDFKLRLDIGNRCTNLSSLKFCYVFCRLQWNAVSGCFPADFRENLRVYEPNQSQYSCYLNECGDRTFRNAGYCWYLRILNCFEIQISHNRQSDP